MWYAWGALGASLQPPDTAQPAGRRRRIHQEPHNRLRRPRPAARAEPRRLYSDWPLARNRCKHRGRYTGNSARNRCKHARGQHIPLYAAVLAVFDGRERRRLATPSAVSGRARPG